MIYAKKNESSKHLMLRDEQINNMSEGEIDEATAEAERIAQEMYDVLKAGVERNGGKICTGCLAPLIGRMIAKGFDGDEISEDAGRVWFYLGKTFEDRAKVVVEAWAAQLNPEQRVNRIMEAMEHITKGNTEQ